MRLVVSIEEICKQRAAFSKQKALKMRANRLSDKRSEIGIFKRKMSLKQFIEKNEAMSLANHRFNIIELLINHPNRRKPHWDF